jgi:hypothetical protein
MVINVKYWKGNTREKQIIKAVSIINGLQNYYHLILKPLDEDAVNDININWVSFCKHYLAKDDEYVIFITDKAFDDNWFSHEDYKFSIITTNDWESRFAPPSLKTYLVYLIAEVVIAFERDLNEKTGIRMGHKYAEGCLFDLCMDKTDIYLGMIAGYICPMCRANLVRFGISEEAIYSVECMLSYVRAEAIGKPILFEEDSAFVVMRFSENDENDHAYLYGIKPALQELNVKCVRADDQILSGPLLKKIEETIEKSRFVIVKADSNNLNVYFELGLAMGWNKDVLLISEKDLVLHLPSDLKNWECLTYTKGDYNELKQKVIKFFSDNYHYIIS